MRKREILLDFLKESASTLSEQELKEVFVFVKNLKNENEDNVF